MPDPNWIREERGWYTSSLGGISLEVDGRWYFWPREDNPIGPFSSLVRAKSAAEIKQDGKA